MINGSRNRRRIGSMQHNEVSELVDLPEGFKPIACEWVFKSKKKSKAKIDC